MQLNPSNNLANADYINASYVNVSIWTGSCLPLVHSLKCVLFLSVHCRQHVQAVHSVPGPTAPHVHGLLADGLGAWHQVYCDGHQLSGKLRTWCVVLCYWHCTQMLLFGVAGYPTRAVVIAVKDKAASVGV